LGERKKKSEAVALKWNMYWIVRMPCAMASKAVREEVTCEVAVLQQSKRRPDQSVQRTVRTTLETCYSLHEFVACAAGQNGIPNLYGQ